MLTRRLLPALFVAVALTAPAALLAEVDKDRDKELEKSEKEARPELDEGHGGDEEHEAYHRRIAEEGIENLKEIQRLLDEVENNLSSKNTGAETQSRQEEVSKKLAELAQKVGQQCSKCAAGGGGGSSKPTSASQTQPQNGQDQQRQGQPRKNQDQVSAAQKDQKNPGGEPRDPGKVPNNRTDEGKNPDVKVDSLLDKMRKGGRWGFLPPKLREEMLSAGGKEGPAEYRDIIQRYYERLSDYYDKNR